MVAAGSKLNVESRSIQRFYDEYLNNEYQVNRRYQRKLVWTLQQKQDLIDSIVNGLPLPLLLLARVEGRDTAGQYEIVDGLQRLDAIVGYLNNEFEWDGKYFNLESMASTKERNDDPKDELKQKGVDEGKVLGRDLARRIANYELPFSIFETDSYAHVDDVFGRINSSGRLLSPQEVRQAGVLTNFAELVRKIAGEIRTDDSLKMLVPLQEAPRFSLDFDLSDRGINGKSVFWYRNGILKSDNLRSSLDEQLVADIILDLLGTDLTLSNDTRDDAYNPNSELGKLIDDRLASAGKVTSSTLVKRRFDHVMSILLQLEDQLSDVKPKSSNARSAALMRHLGLNLTNPSARYFHTLFMAIDGNLIKGSRLKSATKLLNDLAGYFENEAISTGSNWQWQARDESINRLRKFISEAFEPGDPAETVNSQNRLDFVKSRLAKYPHEGELFELKQGLTDISKPKAKQLRNNTIELIKTATAMRNTNPADEAIILIGVVDNPRSMEQLHTFRGTIPINFDREDALRDVQLVGVEHDLESLKIELDEYIDVIKQTLSSNAHRSNPQFVRELANSLEVLPVKGAYPSSEFRHLLFLRVPGSKKEIPFDGDLHVRAGSLNQRAPYDQVEHVQNAFRSLP